MWKGGQASQMESVRLEINEHMTSVGEDILCVLDKQQQSGDDDDVYCVKVDVRVFVLERLSMATEVICSLFQREMETLHIKLHTAEHHGESSNASGETASKTSTFSEEQQEMDQVHGLFYALMQPVVKLHKMDFLHLPVCKEEVSSEHEWSSSLVQEKAQPPRIKEEPEELLQSPEEVMMLLPVKSEDHYENTETEAVGSTSTQYMKTQADVEDWGTSQPIRDKRVLSPHCSESDVTGDSDWEETRECQAEASTSTQHIKTQADVEDYGTSQSIRDEQDLSPHCSESDVTEDSDWEETRECQLAVKTLKSHKARKQTLSSSHKLSQDLTWSTQAHSRVKKHFSCTECGKMFGYRSRLNIHMRSHTGEKPFCCEVCGKGFSHSSDLKIHMRIHTGQRPFGCKVCGKGFIASGNLKKHMMTHTGEKPFRCTVCSKGFRDGAGLKIHLSTHTGEKTFSCELCGKSFGRMSYVKQHLRTHTGEKKGVKPFSCDVCGKRYTDNRNLKEHLRMHTGEKSFSCEVCGKGFNRRSHLKSHLKSKRHLVVKSVLKALAEEVI